jgi:SAM-dependent methyltransferase
MVERERARPLYGPPMPDGRACPACAGPLSPWRTVPASDPVLRPAEFLLLRCTACGTGVTEGADRLDSAADGPSPGGESGLDDHLSTDLHSRGAYRSGNPRLYQLVRPLLESFDRRRLAMLRPLAPPPARLLDAGAGRGRLVAAANLAGYDACGLEPSPRGGEAAGIWRGRIQHTGIEEAQIEPGSVDAVTLWHVLEHVRDPGLALGRIGEWLRPGGAVLIGVPNLDSLQARLGGPRWYHLDVPRHRTHFTTQGLHHLLARHGFAVRRTHQLVLEHNPFGMWQTLVSALTGTPSYLYNLLKRNAPVRSPDLLITAAALPLIPAAALLELLAGRSGHGGTVAVVAVRS